MDIYEAMLIAEGLDRADEATWIEAWQLLIDTGTCRYLQGWYERRARDLIEDGVCTAR